MLPGERIAFIEFKRIGKAPRKLQEHRLKTLRRWGFYAEAIDSEVDFDKLLKELLL